MRNCDSRIYSERQEPRMGMLNDPGVWMGDNYNKSRVANPAGFLKIRR
jgi:hypothetical protein